MYFFFQILYFYADFYRKACLSSGLVKYTIAIILCSGVVCMCVCNPSTHSLTECAALSFAGSGTPFVGIHLKSTGNLKREMHHWYHQTGNNSIQFIVPIHDRSYIIALLLHTATYLCSQRQHPLCCQSLWALCESILGTQHPFCHSCHCSYMSNMERCSSSSGVYIYLVSA